jgi:hypothetical protein
LKVLNLHPITDIEDDFEIAILIGTDNFWHNKVVRGNGPTAVKSKLGNLMSGPLPEVKNASSVSYMVNVITAPPNAKDFERFWNLESMGISDLILRNLLPIY